MTSLPDLIRNLLLAILALLTGLGVFGCAGYPLRFATSDSQVDVPGEVMDNSLSGKVFNVRSNPDSNITVEAWYPDGTNKFRVFRDRAIAYDAFGRQVTTIESNRVDNFERGLQAGLSLATQLATLANPYIPANRGGGAPVRPPDDDGDDNKLTDDLKALIAAEVANHLASRRTEDTGS